MEISFQEQTFSTRSKTIILATAFLQGILLFCLNEVLQLDHSWALMLNLLAVFIPTAIILTFRQSQNRRQYWLFIGGLVILLAAFGWQQGSLFHEKENLSDFFQQLFADGFFFIVLLFCFIALFFFKSYLHENKLIASYPALFGFSWHNYLTLVLSFIFMWIFFGILLLWAGLFKVVEIDFFKDLFEEEWFLYPVLCSVLGYGVVLLRTQVNAVGTIQRILRVLLKSLLPILIGVALLFVAVLPFTGVSLIWEKGYGSGVILGFVYVTLFFFNAVYQDGSENPYPEKISQFLKYAVLVLSVFCALCFYGFILRVQQYGWTEERLWAAILTIVATAFVLLYCFITLFKKQEWGAFFGKVNTVMAGAILLILLLILTPILSLKKLSANSQYDRFMNEIVAAEKVDYAYFSRLGRYGKEKLLLLREHKDIKDKPELIIEIDDSLKQKRWDRSRNLTVSERKKRVEVYPAGVELDPKIWQALKHQTNYGCDKLGCFIIYLDLNDDNVSEVLLFKNSYKDSYGITLIEQKGNSFHESRQSWNVKLPLETIDKLKRLEVTFKPSQWQELYVGDVQVPYNRDAH